MIKNKQAAAPPGWEELPERRTIPERGLLINIDGPEGVGKSSLALTIATLGPVGYIDIDQSVDRARRPEMPKGKKLQVRTLPVRYAAGLGEEATKKSAGPAWQSIKKNTLELAKTWATGGIILDSGTEAWEILRLGSFGTLTPSGRRMDRLYGPVNAEFRQFLRNIHRNHLRHLVVINQVKDEYIEKFNKQTGQKESARTGKQVRVGFKEMGYLADMSIRCERAGGKFLARIEQCKLAPNGPLLEGQVYEDDECDLPTILAAVTDTEVAEWRKS